MRGSVGFGLVLLLAVGVAAADDKKDEDLFQGNWQVTAIEQKGMKVSPEMAAAHKVSFKDNKYAVKVGGEVVEEGTFKLDAAKSPKAVDFTIASGNDNGKKQVGIYEVSTDSLKIMMMKPDDKDRPKDAKDAFVIFGMKKDK